MVVSCGQARESRAGARGPGARGSLLRERALHRFHPQACGSEAFLLVNLWMLVWTTVCKKIDRLFTGASTARSGREKSCLQRERNDIHVTLLRVFEKKLSTGSPLFCGYVTAPVDISVDGEDGEFGADRAGQGLTISRGGEPDRLET